MRNEYYDIYPPFSDERRELRKQWSISEILDWYDYLESSVINSKRLN